MSLPSDPPSESSNALDGLRLGLSLSQLEPVEGHSKPFNYRTLDSTVQRINDLIPKVQAYEGSDKENFETRLAFVLGDFHDYCKRSTKLK